MASNYTEQYGLCQWAPEDSFVRAEFNEDRQKIDTALGGLEKSKAKQSDLATLSQAVTKKAEQSDLDSLSKEVKKKANQSSLSSLQQETNQKARMVCGTYTGDDNDKQFISLPFYPKALLVEKPGGQRNPNSFNQSVTGGLALDGYPLYHKSTPLIEISGRGFYAYTRGEYVGDLNSSSLTYYYLAFE